MTLQSIAVSPASASVAAGLTQQYAATGTYSDGSTQSLTSSVTWTSGTGSVATIAATGLATSKTQGTTTITASSGTVSGSQTLTVTTAAVVSIVVSPAGASVAAGLTQQYAAMGTYTDGSTQNITSSVTWTSGTTSVATIAATGLATSKTQGTTTITASSGAVSGSQTLTVTAPLLVSLAVNAVTVQMGATGQLTATGTYTDGSTQSLTDSVTWSAANGYVVSVGTTGVATPIGLGYSVVTAASGGVSGAGSVTVLGTPRYLYVAADAGRSLTRMAVDGPSGQPRFEGYSFTVQSNAVGFPCLSVDPSGTHAYLTDQVTNTGGSGYSGTVEIYTVNATTGALQPLAGNPHPVNYALGCLAFDPSGKYAYAASGIDEVSGELGEFEVNSDATLTLNNTIGYPYSPTGVVVDPIGRYVYVNVVDIPEGTLGSSELYGYSLDESTGGLTALNHSPWALPNGTYGGLAIHPSGNYLYAADLNGTNILEFTLNRGTGAPTQSGTVDSTCINPAGLQFLPNGSYVYGLCGESGTRSVMSAPVVEFAVGSDGGLTTAGSVLAGPGASHMLVDGEGKFVYVMGSGSDAVSNSSGATAEQNVVLVYQVQSDGSLKQVNQIAGHLQENSMAFVTGTTPVTWTTTSAYVLTAGDDKMTGYAVGAGGTLTAGASLLTPAGPFSGSMLPWDNNLVFATQTAAPNLDAVGISGASSFFGNIPFGTTDVAGGIVIDRRANYAYATDPGAGVVDAFLGNGAGNWSPLYSAPGVYDTFAAGAGARPITMDPAGRYIVVGNQTAKSVSLIEPLGAQPVPATALAYTPLTVTVDATGNLVFVAGDDGKLHMLSSNGMGALTDEADGVLLGTNTVSVALDPLSRFAYAAGPAGLNAFSINATAGTLTPITLSVPYSLLNATGVFEDPSGQFLYVAVSSGTTNALYLFTINADGTLTPSATNPVATPKDVTSMEFNATIQ
ncbi:MAG: Ig-like domain-containing protein [Acidobacteriaceae bacterium]